MCNTGLQIQPIEENTGIRQLELSRNAEPPKYSIMRQGVEINTLTNIRPIKDKNLNVDERTGVARIQQDKLSLFIPNYMELSGLRQSAYILLDFITCIFNERGQNRPTITTTIAEYMNFRALKDKKEASKQLREDLLTLGAIQLRYTSTNTKYSGFINIADSAIFNSKTGIISFTFAPTFFNEVFLKYSIMSYARPLAKINTNNNPNSYRMGRKILEHKRMNLGKKNENTITVKSLLENAPYIPSYEEVSKGGRQIYQRIIYPFERDLTATNICEWRYLNLNHEPLTEEEHANLDYYTFIDLIIEFNLIDYPDQTENIKKREELKAKYAKIKAIKEKNKKRNKK